MNDSLKHLLSLKNPNEIEEIARHLSLEDVEQLLKTLENSKEDLKEFLIPLIKGMPAAHFAIFSNSPLFESLVNTEILQKKIEDLKTHFETILKEYKEEKRLLNVCINELPLFPVPTNLLTSVCDQVVKLADKTAVVIHLIDQILKLTWASSRTDLIDPYSELKNHFTQLKSDELLQSRDLMNRLNSIYGADDKASSLEALPALGIQYIEDLKQLNSIFRNEMNVTEANLLPAIHDHMNAAGLSCIEDLKKHQIYTKEHLFAFLKKTN